MHLRPRRVRTERSSRALALFASAALLWGCLLAAGRPALAQSAPPVPVTRTPAAEPPIGLPRARDYEPVAELWDIYFDFGKAEVRSDDVTILEATAAWLLGNPGYLVLIEGHTDSRGDTSARREFNMDLGQRRAQAAMDHLVAQGVDPKRITILSYGAERPQCAEANERCWAQNRRSRFLVKPRE